MEHKREFFPDGTPIDDWFYQTDIPALAQLGKQYRLDEYGVPDDGEVHTAQIQRVIDLCAETGGVVVIPKGVWKSGSLYFKQGTNLYIEAGGLLLGSDDVEPDANLAQADYVGKSVQTDCLMEVKAGTAAAAVLDMTLANAMIGEGTDYEDLKIVDELAVENYGVAFRKGSDVRDEVNKIFDELVADGSLGALADKYGLELAD